MNKKKRGGVLGTLLRALLLVVLLLLVLSALFLGAWGVTSRPAVILRDSELTVEAGEPLDLSGVRYVTEHTFGTELHIDSSGVDTSVPGEYEAVYSLTQPEIDRILSFVVKNEHLRAVLKVVVRDTTPPALTLYSEELVIGEGDTVSVGDLASAQDLTETELLFEDGSTEKTFTEGGRYELKLLARDSSGNTVSAVVTVIVQEPDSEPPVIIGAEDKVVRTGEVFFPLNGVTAEDNTDPAPAVTAEPETIDTSVPGSVTITYTAADALGNTATLERTIVVADRVAEYEGGTFAVSWDHTGVANQPYLVAVNRVKNVVTVYRQDESGFYTIPDRAFLCSTGASTPLGRYTTEDKYRWQYLFEDSWGQYATRITGHILFHSVPYFTQNPADLEYEEFNKLGTPASLGCVRMSVEDVKWIYDNCPAHFPCVIYDDENSPGPLGTPEAVKLDITDESRRGWDPTDPDPANPWQTAGQELTDAVHSPVLPAESEASRMLEED